MAYQDKPQIRRPRGPEIDMIEQGRLRFQAAVAKGIRGNWYSEVAETALDRIDEITVVVGKQDDPFLKATGAAGYYSDEADCIVLAESRAETRGQRLQDFERATGLTLSHELGHGALDTNQNILDHDVKGLAPFREMFAETVAILSVTGSPERALMAVVNDDHCYPHYRSVYQELGDGPHGVTELAVFMRAGSGTIEEKGALSRSIDAGWKCEGVLAALHNSAKTYMELLEVERPDMPLSQKIEMQGQFMLDVIAGWRLQRS